MYRDLHSARVPCGSILSSKATTTRKRPLNLGILNCRLCWELDWSSIFTSLYPSFLSFLEFQSFCKLQKIGPTIVKKNNFNQCRAARQKSIITIFLYWDKHIKFWLSPMWIWIYECIVSFVKLFAERTLWLKKTVI